MFCYPHKPQYVTRDLVNRRGEPAKIALGLLKLTVPLSIRLVIRGESVNPSPAPFQTERSCAG